MTAGFKTKKIRAEKLVGDKLNQVRKRLGYNLELVEKETKISLRYLEQIENSSYDKLPPKVYVIGFLRRYADFLKLDSDEVITKYQDECNLNAKLNPVKRDKKIDVIKPAIDEKILQSPSVVITPKVILTSLVIILVMSILSYIWYQVKGFAAAPPLELNGPTLEQVVNVESVLITGQTDPGANLFINSQVVSVDQDGSFNQLVKLENGLNSIEIIAKNKANKETRKVIKMLAEY